MAGVEFGSCASWKEGRGGGGGGGGRSVADEWIPLAIH